MTFNPEQPQQPFAEKFAREIVPKFDLWSSTVDESNVADEMKQEIKAALAKFKDHGLTWWQSLDDATYGTIDHILTITKHWKSGDKEAAALFENLRDDLWSFHKEMTS